MASVVIAGDVSGTCTLQAANAAGTTVLSLPTTSGTLMSTTTPINASSITSGTLDAARLPTSGVNASTITAGTLVVAQGGTGANSLTANNVLLGNGTSAVQVVAPGTANNVLTSNGTTWVSSAPTSKVINVETVTNSTRASLSSVTTPTTLVTFTYNKQSASSSLIFIVVIPLYTNFSSGLACDLTYGTSSAFGSLAITYTGQAGPFPMQGQATLTGYTTTGSQTLTVRYYSASTPAAPSTIVNPNSSDDSRNIQQVSTVTVIEYS